MRPVTDVAEISLGAQRSSRFAFQRNVKKALAGLLEEAERRAGGGQPSGLIKDVQAAGWPRARPGIGRRLRV